MPYLALIPSILMLVVSQLYVSDAEAILLREHHSRFVLHTSALFLLLMQVFMKLAGAGA